MRITVSAVNMLVTTETRGYAEYRFFSAAAPHASAIKSIEIVLSKPAEENGPIQCAVRLDLLPSGVIRALARGSHATAAVDRAADRTGWQLRDRLSSRDFTMKAQSFTS